MPEERRFRNGGVVLRLCGPQVLDVMGTLARCRHREGSELERRGFNHLRLILKY
jgi:hypothetical protein